MNFCLNQPCELYVSFHTCSRLTDFKFQGVNKPVLVNLLSSIGKVIYIENSFQLWPLTLHRSHFPATGTVDIYTSIVQLTYTPVLYSW